MKYNTFKISIMNKNIPPYEKIGELLNSIGNPVRIQILLAIGAGEACVCHLETLLELRQAYISQHLMALRNKKIITSRREGKYIYYRLINPKVLEIIKAAGEIMGVSEDGLVIQDHSYCMCPTCSLEENIISLDGLVRGQE